MKIQLKLHPASRVLLAALVLSAASLYSYQVQAATQQPQIPAGVALKSWHENGSDGRYLLQVIEGTVPKGDKPIVGKVVSDANCEADAEGLSHCRNGIELADGSKILVIDTHEMHRNRCMQPGEQISLTRVDKSWVMGQVFKK